MALTRKKKLIVIISVVLVLIAVVGISVTQSRQDVSTVEVETVKRRALLEAKVTANGEIRPQELYELTSEVPGRVVDIYVSEGDTVKAGQDLLTIDSTQLQSSLAGDQAAFKVALADKQGAEVQLQVAKNNVSNARASLAATRYELERSKSDLALARQDYERAQRLVEEEVISKAEFDSADSRFKAAQAFVQAQQSRVEQLEAQLKDAEIRVNQSEAQIDGAEARISQAKARLMAAEDQYRKTRQRSPIKGVVASLPVRKGQYVLASFQSTPLISIADMSQINVEVQVDETDITSVSLGQKAKIKVDALGDLELDGEVKEVAQAPLGSQGGSLGALSGTSQEAKDFKVVIAMVHLSEAVRNRLRPGMSATAIITTQSRHHVVAIPLQAIVERELAGEDESAASSGTETAVSADASEAKKEVEGVFVTDGDRVLFRPVKTGITGETDIEILEGLKENDEIVVGPYRELRSLRHEAVVKKEKSMTAR